MSTHKVLILTSGGDAPGMNAAIRAAVRTAIAKGYDIYGCESGFQGLVEQKIFQLHANSVANCIQRGGTILKSARCEKFKDPKIQKQCSDYLVQQGFTAVIILGGNGSFQGALKLAEHNKLQVIGIPCTIDNDIHGTEYCIGFDTACNTALQAIDRIRDTALSHDRHFIIEVMGRSSGFLAVEIGIAGGAEAIVIPEHPVSTADIIQPIINNKRKKLTSIIVIAEADKPGHSMEIAEEIKQLCNIEYKACILGHTQRGGTPTVRDRTIASRMGYRAVENIGSNNENLMMAVINDHIKSVELPSKDQPTRYFTRYDLLELNHVICGIK
jgi:6-phosphofructokinase 1